MTDATDRRGFLRAAGAAAGLLLLPGGTACSGEDPAKRPEGAKRAPKPAAKRAPKPAAKRPAKAATNHSVVRVRDPEVRGKNGIDATVAERMVNRAVRLATGADDDRAGWKTLFGGRGRVALKLNCLAGPRLSPSVAVVRAIVRGLLGAGVPRESIVLFERTERELRRAGFVPGKAPGGARVLATDMLPGTGHESDITFSGEIGSCFSRVLTEGCEALINVGVLKDHNLAGVSAGLKNLYGVIHNPNKYHDRACDPYVADVAAAEPVRRRLRLTIVDALTAQCEGGPAFVAEHAWAENAVLASLDPVALDHACWARLEAVRKKRGLKALRGSSREPRWIRTAAKKGLGIDDPDCYRLLEV